MLNEFDEIKQYLKSRQLLFWYDGPVSQVLVVEIGDIIRKSLSGAPGKKVATRIFSVLVEQMQNIIRYSEESLSVSAKTEEEAMGKGVVAVGKEGEHYFIISGNVVRTENVKKLSDRLDLIAGMSYPELKDTYKVLRKKEPEPESRGAGLGFLEMARRASVPLEYKIQPLDDNYAYFSLQVIVGE